MMRERVALGLLTAALQLVAWPSAADPLYPGDAGRIEAELELVAIPWDAGDELDDLDPVILFGLMGGVQVGGGLRVQAGVRADVADPAADHLEALLALGWMWTESTTLELPPALRVGLRLEVGWRWLELLGSDFVLNDDGPTAALSGEIGIVPFERFAIALRLGLAAVSGSNGALPETQLQLRAGVAFIGLF